MSSRARSVAFASENRRRTMVLPKIKLCIFSGSSCLTVADRHNHEFKSVVEYDNSATAKSLAPIFPKYSCSFPGTLQLK